MNRDHFRTSRRVLNLRQGRTDWYRIQAKADGPALVHIFDEIGYFGVTAADLIKDLAGVKGDVEVHLNTPGGEVFDGIAIYNALKGRDALVRVVVDSLAASIGSVIAMAADPGNLVVAKNATMMIHDGFGMAVGNAADMREMADLLDRTSDNIASIYADRTGKPTAHWRELMRAESWYTGQEIVDAGLADFLTGAEPAGAGPRADWDLSIFANAPGRKPKKAGKGKQRNADVDNSPWDASKAWHNGAESDDPAAFYNAICAGKKAGDKSTQAAWALPYKYTPSSAPNAEGVRNALSRLPQTDGLTNEAEARALLERLMKQINPDYQPDDRWADEFLMALREART